MMPAIPFNFIITEQLEKEFLEKTIRDIKIETISECTVDYMQQPNFCEADKMIGQKIVKINYNFIYTDNGYLAEFGYTQIRYFNKSEDITHHASGSAKTGSYTVTFIFDEGFLVVVLSGWSCRFNIRQKDIVLKYPFVTKYPIDLTDEEDFTLENFKNWLKTKSKSSITEACVTVKGAFDATVSFMNYALWLSEIHPKTKVSQLTGKQTETIYETVKQLVFEYKNHIRVCEQTDIYGNAVSEKNPAIMDSKQYKKPCPVCGEQIDFVFGGGTKLYFCPGCQKDTAANTYK